LLCSRISLLSLNVGLTQGRRTAMTGTRVTFGGDEVDRDW
jgi:hypothetical protein